MARNRRTNFGAEVSLTPGAYNINKIVLTTHDGKKYNIENITVKLTLTESLYSPNILAQISVKVFIILLVYQIMHTIRDFLKYRDHLQILLMKRLKRLLLKI